MAGSDLRILLCTFPSVQEARQIGTALVERQLAACVNLIPAVESIFRWQGQMETAAETLAIFKTTVDSQPSLVAELKSLHPYEVPEILTISPCEAESAYAAWVRASTTRPTLP